MAIQVGGTTVINNSRVLQNVSGLKTVNGSSILGSGNITAGGGTSGGKLTANQNGGTSYVTETRNHQVPNGAKVMYELSYYNGHTQGNYAHIMVGTSAVAGASGQYANSIYRIGEYTNNSGSAQTISLRIRSQYHTNGNANGTLIYWINS